MEKEQTGLFPAPQAGSFPLTRDTGDEGDNASSVVLDTALQQRIIEFIKGFSGREEVVEVKGKLIQFIRGV